MANVDFMRLASPFVGSCAKSSMKGGSFNCRGGALRSSGAVVYMGFIEPLIR